MAESHWWCVPECAGFCFLKKTWGEHGGNMKGTSGEHQACMHACMHACIHVPLMKKTPNHLFKERDTRTSEIPPYI